MDYISEFESKHVIFGKVLDGMDTLRIMLEEGSGEGFTARPVCTDPLVSPSCSVACESPR